MDDYDHLDVIEYDHHPERPQPQPKEEPEQKAVKTDPWQSYYDFIITEGSFKFWAVFQVGY